MERSILVNIPTLDDLYDSLPEAVREQEAAQHPLTRKDTYGVVGEDYLVKTEGRVVIVPKGTTLPVLVTRRRRTLREELASWRTQVVDSLLRDAQNERINFLGQPKISMTLFRWTGDQRECLWEVIDTGKKLTGDINMHLENTSQWVYAGGLIFTISTYEKWDPADPDARSPFAIHT